LAQAAARLSRIQVWFDRAPPALAWVIAAAAGALAAFGYAPLHLLPAFAAGLVVLIWLLDAAWRREKSWFSFFARGWFWGAGHIAAGMHWISSPFLVEPELWGIWWAAPCMIAFAGGLGLFYGAGAALARPFWTGDWRRLPALAVALGLAEYARGHVLTGFPWSLPAYVWPAGGEISQAAAYVGVYGLSAVTLLVMASPAAIADSATGRGRRFIPLLAAALTLGLIWGAGANRLAHAPVPAPGETPIVRVADSGLGQAEKWADQPDQEWRVLARYAAASGASEESRATVLVWPEGAIPTVNFFLLENPEFLAALGETLGDRALILGLARRAPVGDRLNYYNSAAVIDGVAGAARVSQVYDKFHLVPFGEYIPFWPLVERLAQGLRALGVPIEVAPLQRIGVGFDRGAPPTRLVVPEAAPAVVLICYEAVFSGMVPRGEGRPGWIVNVTNDAWFGGGAGPQQHFNIARYRAIEEGLPMARAATGGVSAIVDAYGRSVADTGRGALFAERQLPLAVAAPLYSNWGFLVTPCIFLIIAVLRFLRIGLPADE
jgi:apolipoprotein N-acyltransferase